MNFFLLFVLGFICGLCFLNWQRSRSDAQIKYLLRDLKPDAPGSPMSSSSQISLAIAGQQKLQHALEQSIEAYRHALNDAPIGWLHVDEENRLLWCNAQAQQLLGITPEHCARLPRLLLELVRSYELDQLIEQSRDSQHPAQKDWTFYPVSADPSQLYHKQAFALRGKAIPLHNEQVGIFIENRQEAVSLRQQRDRWASDVAHELKTPLTSIRLVSETLQSRLDEPLRGWADRLINEAVRLSNLVQDLLDLSQIDRNIPHCLKFTQTNLPDLVQAAWLSLEPLARKKQIKLGYDGPKELYVELDEQRIYRVLINLFDNGIKYSPPRQQIQVEISQTSLPNAASDQEFQMVCLSVIDAGPGFTEQVLPYVFERFYRADPSRSQQLSLSNQMGASLGSSSVIESHSNELQHRSSGLGLSIVQQIVEAHGGVIAASNHPDTGGAWLQVWLPIHQDSANL